jgi:hypothetical protein
MSKTPIDRRDFHKLTTAALSGLAAGALVGCNQPANKAAKADGEATSGDGKLAAAELHLCRGLNDCKGLGKDGKNDCRGQGVCATAKEHTCGGQNECKGLGGCGEEVGANSCKEKGGCHVPLMDDAWDKLRKKKEAEWGEKKLTAGAAPAKA